MDKEVLRTEDGVTISLSYGSSWLVFIHISWTDLFHIAFVPILVPFSSETKKDPNSWKEAGKEAPTLLLRTFQSSYFITSGPTGWFKEYSISKRLLMKRSANRLLLPCSLTSFTFHFFWQRVGSSSSLSLTSSCIVRNENERNRILSEWVWDSP